MAEVADCPHCAAQLAIPAERSPDATAQCPLCDQAFTLAPADVTRLAEARLLPATHEAPERPIASDAEHAGAKEETPNVSSTSGGDGLGAKPAWRKADDAAPPPNSRPQPASDAAAKLSDWFGRAADASTLSAQDDSPHNPGFSSRTPDESASADEPSIESLLSRFRGEPLSDDDSTDEHARNAPGARPTGDSPSSALSNETGDGGVADESSEAEGHGEGGQEHEEPRPSPPDAETLQAVHALAYRSNSRRRRRSMVGQLVGIVLFGIIGLALGAYGLLWIKGPEGDFLGISRFLPNAMLPESLARPRRLDLLTQSYDDQTRLRSDQPADADTEPAPPIEDEFVEPATFEEPEPTIEEEDAGAAPSQAQEPSDPQQDAQPAARQGVTLLGAPTPYPMERLLTVMDGAEDARRVLSESSLAEDPGAAKTLGAAYAKLCELAQVLTFVDTSEPDPEFKRLTARELYQRLFVYRHARADSADIAVKWLNWTGRPHGGVFFAGDLMNVSPEGSVYEYHMKLGDGSEVVVLVDDVMDARQIVSTKEMGVVGCVVENATERVEGYTGDVDRAVWARHTFPLGKPKFE